AHLGKKFRAGKHARLRVLRGFDDNHYSHLDLSFVFGLERPPSAPLACSIIKSNETPQNRQLGLNYRSLLLPTCFATLYFAAAVLLSCACCRPRMSIFSICNIAFITRPDFAGSGSLTSLPNAVGITCQDPPNLSPSQPHLFFFPFSQSFSHISSSS